MITEIFIENRRLDISENISTLLNFAIDDIKDFSERSTTWSKTVILPGTANNNKLFGHIFQIGQANNTDDVLDNVGYNFNATKAASCIVFQDQMQTFKGILRLMQINITKGQIEYEVSLFGELAGLNVALSGSLLEDLDFSAYDHTYDETEIIASWANTNGTGVYYPLIDYGTYSLLKADWDIRTFRPALHVREYIDKMFTAAGFRWTSALFDTARFKTLIIPHNQKTLQSNVSQVLTSSKTGSQLLIDTGSGDPSSIVEWETYLAGGFSYSSGVFTYTAPTTITTSLSIYVNGTRYSPFAGSFNMSVRKNGVAIETQTFSTSASVIDFVYSATVPVTLATGDTIDIFAEYVSGGLGMLVTAEVLDTSMIITSDIPTLLPVAVGGTVTVNDTIPKNVRQVEFLLGIIKLFNLYCYESINDSRLIYITPYIDFYSTDSTDSVDWTYKLNRDKTIRIKPMSEINAKKYDFRYKPDADFFNEAYRKRYGQGYGDHVFDSQYEFANQVNQFEIIFSATPLVGYSGEDKVFSTIFKQSNDVEERIDSNIRIMQSKKITGVASWDIKDDITVLTSVTDYGYAGHFDDPDAPSNDLNFGALNELFFILVSGDLTATQFNVYWSAYMAEITDKDSKLLTAWFYLTVKDILQLDFSKKIYVDGNLFRLNKIKDYNMTSPGDCEVELLKINYLIY